MSCTYRWTSICLLLGTGLLCLPSLAATQDVLKVKPFGATPAELLSMDPGNAPADLDVEVFMQEVLFTVDEQSRITSRRRLLYRVHTQNGAEKWAGTGASYRPWRSDKPEIKARVVTKDGTEHWLQAATLVDSAASGQENSVYSDRRRLSGPLPAMAAGAVVEEQITIRDHRAYFGAGVVTREAISANALTHRYRIVIDAPKSLKLRYRLRGADRGADRKPKRKVSNGRQVLTFMFKDRKPVKEWPTYSGPDVAMVPFLEFSTGKSWNDVARAYSKTVDAQLAAFDAKKIADALVATGDDRTAKIAKLLAYVHSQVRYTGLELGERALVPATPDETLQRHYGDCKDKATLLVGLLRAQGIAAHVALLNAGEGIDVPQKLPGLGLFDHAIVYVPGAQPLWIDATADTMALGSVPFGDQSRRALVAASSTKKLIVISDGRAQDNRYREDVHVEFVDGGKGRVREVTTGAGAIAAGLRADYAGTATTLAKQLAKYSEARFTGKYSKHATAFVKDVSKPVVLTLDLDASKLYESFDDGGYAPVSAYHLYTYIPEILHEDEAKKEKQKKRDKHKSDEKDPRYSYLPKYPTSVRPHTYEVAYHLTAPAGFIWQGLPEGLSARASGIEVWRKIRLEGERLLHVEYGIRSERQYVAVGDLPAVQKALTDFSERSTASIRFVHAANTELKQHKVTAGLQRHRELMRRYPNHYRTHSRYAQALVGLGFGAEAREVAKKLTRRWPKEAHAYWTYGYVLLFDPLGRDGYPGSDYGAAEVQFRKAIALEPDERQHYRALRGSLNRGDEGGTELPERRRRELLRALLEEKERFGEDDELDEEIVRSHIWLGEFDQAIEVAETMKPTKFRDALWVAALTGDVGLDAAMEKATELGTDPRPLLKQAASALALMGHDAVGARIGASDRAFPGTPYASAFKQTFDALVGRSACLEKMGPVARSLHDFILPYVWLTDSSERITDLKDKKHPSHSSIDSMQATLRRMRKLAGSSDGARSLTVRSWACMMRWDEEQVGDAMRVRVHREGTKAGKDAITWYMRKVGKGYIPVAAQDGSDLSGLGRQALRALKRRKVSEARAWLSWAHELTASHTSQQDWYSTLEALRALWPASLEAARPEQLWLAAAAASSWRPIGGPEQRVFAKALNSEQDPVRVVALKFGLARALSAQRKFGTAADLFGELARDRPNDKGIHQAYIRRLSWADRHPEVLAALPKFAEAFSDTEEFVRSFRHRSLRQTGRYAECLQETRARRQDGEAKSSELNSTAWSAMFYGADLRPAVDLATESVRLDKRARNLHTLAAIHVELGELDDAHRHLAESIKVRNQRRATTDEWLTVAMLADGLGLDRAVKEAIKQLKAPEHPSEMGSWALYQRWSKERTVNNKPRGGG